MQHDQQPVSPSRRLARWTDEAEHIFNHLLGYVIAGTALVAFMDVLGNGRITGSIPWLFWMWTGAQGLGVEFQVFILIRRLPRLWHMSKVLFGVHVLFILALGYMSVVIGSVFVEHDNRGGTIDAAMASLRINHVAFVYERAAMAILLVALIALDRALEQHDGPRQQGTSAASTTNEAIHNLVERIEQLQVTVTEITERARSGLPAVVPLPHEARRELVGTDAERHIEALAVPSSSHESGTEVEPETEPLDAEAQLSEAYHALRALGTLSASALARRAHVRKATALVWLTAKQAHTI